MKELKELKEFYDANFESDLVLCTLVRKSGSSYRGLAAKKLITIADGQSCGLLSGGCLEGDIVRSACESKSFPFIKSFSTLGEEDRLMGYQTGCTGVVEILFEKLPAKERTSDGNAYEKNVIDLYLPFGNRAQVVGVKVDLRSSSL
ncbi:MAG: XdhC family protein, partial [Proteobacteria bacterium]